MGTWIAGFDPGPLTVLEVASGSLSLILSVADMVSTCQSEG